MRLTTLVTVALLTACTAEPRAPEVADVLFAPRVEQALEANDALSKLALANRDFRTWLAGYQSAEPSARASMLEQGTTLATARRVVMRELLLSAPQKALPLAFNPVERAALPGIVRERVERWRDGVGTLNVVAATPNGPVVVTPVERFVSFDDASTTMLRAGVSGRRFAQKSQEHLRLHGVELDGVIGLTESPLRKLFPGEKVVLPSDTPSICPTSKRQIEHALVFHTGDSTVGFCVVEHAQAEEYRLTEQEKVDGIADAVWSLGPKTILVIRVDFSDRPGDPVSESDMKDLIDTQTNTFFVNASYGQTSMISTVTATLRMPKTAATYGDASDLYGLRNDALAAARAAGIEPNDYNLDIVAPTNIFHNGAGFGAVGTRGLWMNGNYSLRISAHELGHNYGVYHANFWSAGQSIISANGGNVEYGNPFDMMGSSGNQNSHFNVWFKRIYQWVPSTEVQVVSTSGTYRMYALETAISSGNHGLKVPRGGDPLKRDYWLEFRQALPGNASAFNGAVINFGYPYSGANGSHLLDMTPDGNTSDSALVIGRTFSDPLAGIYLTPVGKGGTTPESLDVVVNLGTFAGNRAPTATIAASASTVANNTSVTFTVTASDPDGDTLAYAWDFDDGTFGPNTAVASKTLGGDRVFFVRCTVSDMKGHLATVGVPVTVGTPSGFSLSGKVTSGGVGLEGVRVSDGARVTTTLSTGDFVLTNVPAGSQTLSASKFDFAISASFTNPVTVSAAASGLDFTAVANASYSINGNVYASGSPLVGALVTNGSLNASNSGSAGYSISPVAGGRYAVSASMLGWAFGPAQSIEIMGGNGTANFYATGQYLFGTIPAAQVATAPVVTDGVRSVTCTLSRGEGTGGPQGGGGDGGVAWVFSLGPIPPGEWNLTATSPGVTIEPDTFTNPLTLTGGQQSFTLLFKVVTGTTYQVSGQVLTGGTPLSGVVVSDGTRSATTDVLGKYVVVGVPPGSYTLTPTRSGVTFVPVSRSVTVGASDVTGQDFATTVVNAAPTVATAAAATPSPVVSGVTSVLSVLGADPDGPESGLTYTWLATSGNAAVTYTANGTNAAKSTTATFAAAGSYTFQVTITDPGGLTVKSQVTVVVNQIETAMQVAPTSANVLPGGTAQFTATLTDQFGTVMGKAQPTWSVPSAAGTVSSSGLFTAGGTPGGPYTLSASSNGVTGTASVIVTASGSPTLVAAAKADPSPVVITTTSLSVLANDDTGEAGLTYTWASTGPATVAFSANGSNAAKTATATFTTAGAYDFTVTITDGDGHSIASAVHVVVVPTATTIEVQPSVAMVQVSTTQQFAATVNDQFGHPLASNPAVAFTVSGGGTITGAGLFTAGAVAGGPFTVTATLGSVSGQASLVVSLQADTMPPTVSVSAPVAGTRVIGPAVVTVTATDNVGVVKVEIFVDGVKVGEDTQPPFSVMVDFSALTNGSHVLTAKATDAAGNSSTSDAVMILVGPESTDVSAPVVSIVTPTGGEVGLTVPVTVSASDDVAVVSVKLELDGVVVRELTQLPWAATIDVAAGDHTLVAIASDASGKSTRSAAVMVTAKAQPDGGGTGGGAGGGSGEADGGSAGLDGGSAPGTGVTGRCGCTSGGPVPMALGLALLGWLSRRRREP